MQNRPYVQQKLHGALLHLATADESFPLRLAHATDHFLGDLDHGDLADDLDTVLSRILLLSKDRLSAGRGEIDLDVDQRAELVDDMVSLWTSLYVVGI